MEAWATLAPQIAVALVIVACAAWLAREMRKRPNGDTHSDRSPVSKRDLVKLEGQIDGRLQGYQRQLDCLTEEQSETTRAVTRQGGKLDAILMILRRRGGDDDD